MNIDELEKWDKDFDAGLIDISAMERVPTRDYSVVHAEKRCINSGVDNLDRKPIALSRSDFIAYVRVRRYSIEECRKRVEKSKGRYSKSRRTIEAKDLTAKEILESSEAARRLSFILKA